MNKILIASSEVKESDPIVSNLSEKYSCIFSQNLKEGMEHLRKSGAEIKVALINLPSDETELREITTRVRRFSDCEIIFVQIHKHHGFPLNELTIAQAPFSANFLSLIKAKMAFADIVAVNRDLVREIEFTSNVTEELSLDLESSVEDLEIIESCAKGLFEYDKSFVSRLGALLKRISESYSKHDNYFLIKNRFGQLQLTSQRNEEAKSFEEFGISEETVFDSIFRHDYSILIQDFKKDERSASLEKMPFDKPDLYLEPLRAVNGQVLGIFIMNGKMNEKFGSEKYTRLSRLLRVLSPFVENETLRQSYMAVQDQLHLADRMATVGTLAAGVAHEINNPLTFVMGNMELCLERAKKDPTITLCENIPMIESSLKGTERIKKIVKDLKRLSSSKAAEEDIVDIHAVLQFTIALVAKELSYKSKLTENYKDVPFVIGNEDKLGQVFLNLVMNAIQAMSNRDPDKNEIKVSTFRDDRGWAIIEVSDNGEGIPEHILKRIFDPFFTTKSVNSGTGLGLSICRGIVVEMGGEIKVSSKSGKGTVFTIQLPPYEPDGVKKKMEKKVVSRTIPQGLKILIVDDEPDLNEALKIRLARGNEITTTTDGSEAIELLSNGERFDVVFCDMMMPKVTGEEIYENIKSKKTDLADRFIFMTGGAFTEQAKTFLEKIRNPVVDKPFEKQRLIEAIESVIV